jgi:acetylornithine deacetylase
MSRTSSDALALFVEERTPEWIAMLQALIRERSIFEHEHGVVDLVCDRLAKLGVPAARVFHDRDRLAALPGAQPPFSAVPGRASVAARLPGRATGASLALNAHLDIVSEGGRHAWTCDPFAAQIEGDRIFGRGAMDDKAGVAVALAVLEVLIAFPVEGDVVLHLVLEDETTGNGSLLCLDAGYTADAAVIIDGTRPERAIDRHAGQLRCRVAVAGRPASVSVSHMGVNAADLLARLVARLADRVAGLNEQRSAPWTRFPSPFQFVTQRLAADSPPLTVPDYAEATCHVTFPPPWTVAAMRLLLTEETAAFAAEKGLDAAPVLTDEFSAEPVNADAAPLAAALSESALHEGFGAIDIGPSTGTSDMRHFAAAGIPCLLYGPGHGLNPHRPDEYYQLSDLPRMVKVFARLATSWCGAPRPSGPDRRPA